MRSWFLVSCLVSLAACGDKEGADCTEVGCGDDDNTAFFSISEPASGWASEQDVTYRVFVRFDGEEEICAGTPATGMWCDGELLSGDPGTASDGSSISLDALVLETLPESVELVIEREDAEVVNQTFTIEPDLSYPNGPECAPVCATWSGTVEGW